MPITENDIKMLASQRMTDTPDGGGRMTGTVVQSGVDNNIFDDVSNLDRVYGNVGLRKWFAAILTDDTDKYLGMRITIDKPPADDNVEALIFDASSTFDTRDEAKARLEAYLAPGSPYQGLLYGPHIVGMMSILLFQQLDRDLPGIGETLLLRKTILGVVTEQYVRVTSVTGEELRFTDASGDFVRRVVTCTIGDALRYDFEGFEPQRADTDLVYGARARVFETLVANAAQYYGIRPLATAASMGAYNIKADSTFSALVPSAQIETPLIDLNGAGLNVGYAPTGTTISYTVNTTFSATVSLSLGAGVAPGTLMLTLPSTTVITDTGYGVLLANSAEVGAVDYENGIATLSDAVYNATGNIQVSYELGAPVSLSLQSDAIPVTVEGRSLTYVFSLHTKPAPGTLSVSYMANGRWYVIRDRGDGIIKGLSAGLGAGNVNYATRSGSVTLGALPDVGSHIILQWGQQEAITTQTPAGSITSATRLLYPTGLLADANTDSVTVAWNDGSAKTFGWSATGGATGSGGTFRAYGALVGIDFDALPPFNTAVSVTGQKRVSTAQTYAASSTASFTLPSPPLRGSVSLSVALVQTFHVADWNGFATVLAVSNQHAMLAWSDSHQTATVTFNVVLVDSAGDGVLRCRSQLLDQKPYAFDQLALGTVDYTTGAVSIPASAAAHSPTWAGPSVFGWKANGDALGTEWVGFAGTRTATTAVAAQSSSVSYRTGTLEAFDHTFNVDQLQAELRGVPDGNTLTSLTFKLGTGVYRRSVADASKLLLNPSPLTGAGTEVGTVSATAVTMTTWPALTANSITEFAAVAAKATAASADIYMADRMVFRAPNAPLRPGSFTVQGRLASFAGGPTTTFSETADENGIISTSDLVGYVDFNTGICHLYARASGAEAAEIPSIPRPTWLASVSGAGGYPTTWSPGLLVTASVSFNAVAYSYLPLDANILGLDPVRLPSDGRVPIFKAGRVVVIHNTQQMAPATVSNGQTLNTSRTRLARVRVIGANGSDITTGWTADLDAGTVTFSNVAGYSQPVTVEHRIEDEALCADAQITGDLRLTRPLTHNFPANTSYVSSALIAGTKQAASTESFSQSTWTSVWSDTRIGSPITAQYNQTLHPIVVTNRGAIDQRWAFIFTNNTTFRVVGDTVGEILTGNTGEVCAPLNPATGAPYFSIAPGGWGSGWVAGNVLRDNTKSANHPVWVSRTVMQSPAAPPGTDQIVISIRGDIDV